jgi:hypothetical protein
MMVRTTVMIPRELRIRSARRARERGMSFGELVRESLAAEVDSVRADPKADPLFADRAVYRGSAPTDLSVDHDAYLYGDRE